MSALLLIVISVNQASPSVEHSIVADWQEMESATPSGDAALEIIRDSRVLASATTRTLAEFIPWRVRFDRENIRIDGIPQWIDLATGRPARVPDRIADIDFGRDYGNAFKKVVKHFEGRPISIVLNKTAKWNAGLRELDKALIYALAFVIRPISNSLNRQHADQRTYGLSCVAGPSGDYLVVQDLRQNQVVREIWVDPAHRHRIMRVVEFLHGQPILQLDYEYVDFSVFPSQWTVLRLGGDRIVDFAKVQCTSAPSGESISSATFVLSEAANRTQRSADQDWGLEKQSLLQFWPAIGGLVLVSLLLGKFVTSAFKATARNKLT